MKCKNCGANIENSRGVCPVCGAVVVEDEGVNLGNIKYDSAKYDYAPVNKKKRFIIASIVIILIFAIASFAFFYVRNLKIPQPEMSFTTGQGIINDDEHIIYAFIDDSSHLEYIHGVNLYEGKIDENTIKISKPQTISIQRALTRAFVQYSSIWTSLIWRSRGIIPIPFK